MLNNILDNLNLSNFDLVDFLIRIFVVLFSLSVHEFAHGRWAYRLGDDTAYNAGRLTLNPLAHLDPIGTLMMIVARVGWAKPVPINPVKFKRAKTMKRGIVEVSLAGPLSNLLLSFISYFLLMMLRVGFLLYTNGRAAFPEQGVLPVLAQILESIFILNVFLAVFNLLPVPPLDGFKILGSLLPNEIYYKLMSYERYIGIVFLFIVAFAGTYFSYFLHLISIPFYTIITWPLNKLAELLINLFG